MFDIVRKSFVEKERDMDQLQDAESRLSSAKLMRARFDHHVDLLQKRIQVLSNRGIYLKSGGGRGNKPPPNVGSGRGVSKIDSKLAGSLAASGQTSSPSSLLNKERKSLSEPLLGAGGLVGGLCGPREETC